MKHKILIFSFALNIIILNIHAPLFADEPIVVRGAWSGPIDFYNTGAPLAIDSNLDPDNNVDSDAQPVSVGITSNEIPSDATILKAFLYWSGTQSQPSGLCSAQPDNSVSLTVPGLSQSTITADITYCSDGGSSNYDIQVSRADVTEIVKSGSIYGTYTFDGFSFLLSNGATDNASFSLVFIFTDESLPSRKVILLD